MKSLYTAFHPEILFMDGFTSTKRGQYKREQDCKAHTDNVVRRLCQPNHN